jgi:hypothetical protein
VVLTLQDAPDPLRAAIAELAARLRKPFILFGPTSRSLDAASIVLLAAARAAFFPLEAHARLAPHGAILPRTPPGELFAAFAPHAREPMPEDVARQAFAMVKALDSEQRLRVAPVYTVFRLYCVENLSASAVARRCRCSKTAIVNRLRMIERRTGAKPDKLRAYSRQFEDIEDSLSDSRAKVIHRAAAIQGAPPAEADDP